MGRKVESPDLLNRLEAAAYLRTTAQTLARWASTKRFALPYIRVGGLVRYRRSDLDAFLEARTVHGVKPPKARKGKAAAGDSKRNA